MATGMEWMLQAVLSHMGIDPEVFKKQVAGTGQIIVDAKAQLDRIEGKLDATMRHLGISLPDAVPAQLQNGAGHGSAQPGTEPAGDGGGSHAPDA